MSLEGKIALVTGSGRNIGKATAIELSKKGAQIAVNARNNNDEANSVRDYIIENGGKAISVIADVGNEIEVSQMFAEIESSLGPVAIRILYVRDEDKFDDGEILNVFLELSVDGEDDI